MPARRLPGESAEMYLKSLLELGGDETHVPISALASTTLAVKVVDEHGLAVPNAVVSVVELSREATTDADGSCEFDSLPPGTYHLSAQGEGFASARTEVSVPATATAKAVIALSPAVHFSESVTVAPGGATPSSRTNRPASSVGKTFSGAWVPASARLWARSRA